MNQKSVDTSELFLPAPFREYQALTNGGQFNVDLTQDQAAVCLKAHDYGIDALSIEEKSELSIIVSKLKSEIWP
jgi:hypothetical protein